MRQCPLFGHAYRCAGRILLAERIREKKLNKRTDKRQKREENCACKSHIMCAARCTKMLKVRRNIRKEDDNKKGNKSKETF